MNWWQILLIAVGVMLHGSYLLMGALVVRALRSSILCRDLTWREWFVGLFGWPYAMYRLIRFEHAL